MSEQVTTDDSSIDSAASALSAGLGGGCARVALVVAIHDLASHFENALYAFRDDADALLKAKRDIAWARKVAARHNHNGTGCNKPPNAL
jgi:hypothetical protein